MHFVYLMVSNRECDVQIYSVSKWKEMYVTTFCLTWRSSIFLFGRKINMVKQRSYTTLNFYRVISSKWRSICRLSRDQCEYDVCVNWTPFFTPYSNWGTRLENTWFSMHAQISNLGCAIFTTLSSAIQIKISQEISHIFQYFLSNHVW